MSEVWIPVYNRKFTDKQKASLLREVLRAHPDRVLLTFARVLRNEEMLQRECGIFQENMRLLSSRGIRVGAWLAPTIGYGSAFYGDNGADDVYTHITTLRKGYVTPGAYCPWDEDFTTDLLHTLSALARTGVDLIMLEDDFTLAGGKTDSDVGCACDRHISAFCERCGSVLTREEIAEKVFTGGKNRYRDFWIDLQTETLGTLARRIEQTVHAVSPSIRLGFSANGTSFESEGAPVCEYARILAGNTRPFLRLTGAPYWKQSITLPPAIEAVRMQSHWCGEDIELISEGDTYPRPRHWVPAAHLEAYDMILRADGCTNGILKYMIDYNSSAGYETGYIDRHLADRDAFREIDRRFSGKRTVGVAVAEFPAKMRDSVYGETNLPLLQHMPPFSVRFLCDNSIPTAYDCPGYPCVAFGENTRHLSPDQIKSGVITDAHGARILCSRGYDVGFTSMSRISPPHSEYYPPYDEYTCLSLPPDSLFFDMTLKRGADVVSEFILSDAGLGVINGAENAARVPACYRYRSADGLRFMVYTFVAETAHARNEWVFGLSRSYCRQKQLCDGINWLGRPLPATCSGAPDLYILCKKDLVSMTVGIWNLFADSVLSPVITLDDAYQTLDCYRCGGALSGQTVTLTDDIPPYGFVCFTVRK